MTDSVQVIEQDLKWDMDIIYDMLHTDMQQHLHLYSQEKFPAH